MNEEYLRISYLHPEISQWGDSWAYNAITEINLASILHKSLVIPGSLIAQNKDLIRLIILNKELLDEGAIAVDLNAKYDSFDSLIRKKILDDEMLKYAGELDLYAKNILRYTGESVGGQFKKAMQDALLELLNYTDEQDEIVILENSIKQISETTGSLHLKDATNLANGTKFSSGVKHTAYYYYCVLSELNVSPQVPYELISKASFNKISFNSKPYDFTMDSAKSIFDFFNVSQSAVSKLTPYDILKLRTDPDVCNAKNEICNYINDVNQLKKKTSRQDIIAASEIINTKIIKQCQAEHTYRTHSPFARSIAEDAVGLVLPFSSTAKNVVLHIGKIFARAVDMPWLVKTSTPFNTFASRIQDASTGKNIQYHNDVFAANFSLKES